MIICLVILTDVMRLFPFLYAEKVMACSLSFLVIVFSRD